MQVVFLKNFSKDIDKITQPKDRQSLAKVIELVKVAAKLEDITRSQEIK